MATQLQRVLVVLALSACTPLSTSAEEILEDLSSEARHLRSLQTRKPPVLRASATSDPDTIWIGHIADPTWVPKDKNGVPLPGVPAGGYGPYHVGRGENRPGFASGTDWNGVWDFDHFQPGETDSLMGWWPVARPFPSMGGFGGTSVDRSKAFMGFDYGNQGNYVINQGSPKRTFGVVSYWHRDVGSNVAALPDTGTVVSGPNVEWAPLAGGASAWCGLRAHGDVTHVDDPSLGGTGNPFNQSVLEYNGSNSFTPGAFGSVSPAGTDKNYPGYGSQWDQILYRDLLLEPGQPLQVSFKYVHALSPIRGGTVDRRIGYFWKDPLKPAFLSPPFDGNFISASDSDNSGVGGPMDSLSVYIGVPVEPVPGAANDFVASDGVAREITDPRRRWFSEVIRTNGPMIRVLSATGFSDDPANGVRPANAPPEPVAFAATVPGEGTLASIAAQGGGRIRLVFRVKTNRGTDDEDHVVTGFTSFTRGAAIVDDVVANGWESSRGDFEGPGAINNDPAVTALDAWKATGKPPSLYVHRHSVDPSTAGALRWNDPCSPPVLDDVSSPNRTCSMLGNVLTGGDHDAGEITGGVTQPRDRDRERMAVSPTILLATDPSNPGAYNAMGLSHDLISTATDFALWFDVHTASINNANGQFRAVGLQSYPAAQSNGARTWGEVRFPTGITFYTIPTCAGNLAPLRSAGLMATSNASGIPDSVRVYFRWIGRCSFQAPFGDCTFSNPNLGGYVDNLSFAIIRTPSPGLSLFPWFWYTDAFPATSSSDFTTSYGAGLAFDTTAALVKSAVNRAPGAPGLGLTRPTVQGDSAQVTTGPTSAPTRVDLVFRILPGVGNYVTLGNRASPLRRVPTSTTPASANASSTNFWESYLGHNGEKGTPGGHTGGTWSPHVWNSARMDTLEQNLFPAQSLAMNLSSLDPANWQTTYHEADPKYATLGIAKNRCFVVDASAGRPVSCATRTPTSVTQCNTICSPMPTAGTFPGDYPPLWTEDVNSGFLYSESSLPPGRTYEFTKIIPDGQLTPGSHVQYFYRREPGLMQAVDLFPDTSQIFSGAQVDGARWYHFSILPDRWKSPAFAAGGSGMACMLVVDVHDRSGDEFFWVSAADSIGLTAAGKRGAHSGWYAAGGVNTPGTFDLATLRRDNGGQPGTVWDLWNVRGAESPTTSSAWLANRRAAPIGAGELLAGKDARTGPTGEMLRHFYRTLVFLTGSLKQPFFGPSGNRTDDDFALLGDFANQSAGTPRPRSVYVIGSGFSEAVASHLVPGGPSFLGSYFGARVRRDFAGSVITSYRSLSGDLRPVVTLSAAPGSAFDVAGAQHGLQGMTFGLRNSCNIENDVLDVEPTVPTAVAQTFGENVGSFAPYVHSIYAPSQPGGRGHITFLDGTRISHVGSPANVPPLGRDGFRAFMFKSLSIVNVGCGPQSLPFGFGDGPLDVGGSAYRDFVQLRSPNPMRAGHARISFGVASTDRVQVRIFDVTGRVVRSVADRVFAAGQEHVVTWDGADDAGHRVRSGVYFYQLATSTWKSQRKLVVLGR